MAVTASGHSSPAVDCKYLNFEILAPMRVISNKALSQSATVPGEADAPLQTWRKIVEIGTFSNYPELKGAFNATDKVGNFYVSEVGGNRSRVISSIHFNRQMLFVRHVFTRKEYDKP
jgi:mRNA interferase HigB